MAAGPPLCVAVPKILAWYADAGNVRIEKGWEYEVFVGTLRFISNNIATTPKRSALVVYCSMHVFSVFQIKEAYG